MSDPASMIKMRPLRIMKFGGTSVGDASSIRRVAEIVRNAADESDLVVVVSAMAGVTNKLIEAAARSEAGDLSAAEAIFAALRAQHDSALNSLVQCPGPRTAIHSKMQDCYEQGEQLCKRGQSLRELSLKDRDLISSLGERLCAPLVAAALTASGVESEAIDATEIVVTDSCHGAANPCVDATRERCQERIEKLLQQGIVPVVTGFIGATSEGVLTTLGRGGSDYSATILGAALGADEVIIWTDVDGLMTADPRTVAEACTIPEISYREAAELARFGAKVLHPKTLRALTQCGIPLWIRNTFAPHLPGTRITPAGPAIPGVVKGLTAMLRCEAAQEPGHKSEEEDATLDATAAILTVVGTDIHGTGAAARMLGALSLAQVNVVAMFEGAHGCSLSVVIARTDKTTALAALHREFQLGETLWPALSAASPAVATAAPYYQSEPAPADGD
ncbi:MAG: aspartate kinase [Candidatus Sulfotelmatobacter sp.]